MAEPEAAGSSFASSSSRGMPQDTSDNPFNQDPKLNVPGSKFTAPATTYTFPPPKFTYSWTAQPSQSTAESSSVPAPQPEVQVGSPTIPTINWTHQSTARRSQSTAEPSPTPVPQPQPRIKVGSPQTYKGNVKPHPEFR